MVTSGNFPTRAIGDNRKPISYSPSRLSECVGNEREYHPTQKPRWLLQKLLQVSSKPGDVVLDPFAGSGSTAFAVGHMPRRKFILVEPEPKYVGLIQSIAKDEFGCKVTLKDN